MCLVISGMRGCKAKGWETLLGWDGCAGGDLPAPTDALLMVEKEIWCRGALACPRDAPCHPTSKKAHRALPCIMRRGPRCGIQTGGTLVCFLRGLRGDGVLGSRWSLHLLEVARALQCLAAGTQRCAGRGFCRLKRKKSQLRRASACAKGPLENRRC